jgi:hypothetical protein
MTSCCSSRRGSPSSSDVSTRCRARSWPKRTAGVATDLRESIVREVGLAHGLVDNKVCAVDDRWSGLRFVIRVADRPKRNGSRSR